jgi:hypothetical protein
MNSLHRQHLTSPAATCGAHCLRSSLWVVSYPLAHVLPLLIGYSASCPVTLFGSPFPGACVKEDWHGSERLDALERAEAAPGGRSANDSIGKTTLARQPLKA